MGKRDVQGDQPGFCAAPHCVGTPGPTLNLRFHRVLGPFLRSSIYSPRCARLSGRLCLPMRGPASSFASLTPAAGLNSVSLGKRNIPEVRLGGRCGSFTTARNRLMGLCALPSFCAAQKGVQNWPPHPHPCLYWPEALSPWHRLHGRSMNSPRPGLWHPEISGQEPQTFMLNSPNLSGKIGSPESLLPRPEASRHKGQGTVPACLTTAPLILPGPPGLCELCPSTLDSLPDRILPASVEWALDSCSLSWATCGVGVG